MAASDVEDAFLGYALKAAFGVAVKEEGYRAAVKQEAPGCDDSVVSVASDASDDGYGAPASDGH